MHIIWTILLGLAAGIIAKFIFPGKENMGWIMTTLLGIAGSFVATYLGKVVGIYQPGETAGFIGAIVGALIILFIISLFRRKAH
ncbi:MAG: GlsB/YeaQ/YmgE family stress response membrane protein [Candidatus Saccharicenans sp.]|uniref:GlsB/YeaQ/YmgE family stress response membrane protein n=1 Tax=Candidatus Saccharicenans sp. TaxID=2819258 RepID=UPI004049EEC5